MIDFEKLGRIMDEAGERVGEQVPDILAAIGIRGEPCPPEVVEECRQMAVEIKARRAVA